jgi:hypothetical protein
MPPEDPIYAAAVAELAAIKAKLARMEALAAEPPPAMDSALSAHFSAAKPPVDRTRARLLAIARGWQPDPQREAELVARAKDPAGYAAAQRGESPLVLSLYELGRSAALAAGTWTAPAPEGTPS